MTIICRTCGEHIFSSETKNIFDADNLKILLNIHSLTGIQIFEDQDLPKHICQCCHVELHHSISFRERCKRTENILQHQKQNLINDRQNAREKQAKITVNETILQSLDYQRYLQSTKGKPCDIVEKDKMPTKNNCKQSKVDTAKNRKKSVKKHTKEDYIIDTENLLVKNSLKKNNSLISPLNKLDKKVSNSNNNDLTNDPLSYAESEFKGSTNGDYFKKSLFIKAEPKVISIFQIEKDKLILSDEQRVESSLGPTTNLKMNSISSPVVKPVEESLKKLIYTRKRACIKSQVCSEFNNNNDKLKKFNFNKVYMDSTGETSSSLSSDEQTSEYDHLPQDIAIKFVKDSAVKTYVCHLCGVQLKCSGSFKGHMLQHEDDKKFECDECGKNYYTKFQLALHLRAKH